MKFAKKRTVLMWMTEYIGSNFDQWICRAVMFSNPSRYKVKK